jgi:hypothetical protein
MSASDLLLLRWECISAPVLDEEGAIDAKFVNDEWEEGGQGQDATDEMSTEGWWAAIRAIDGTEAMDEEWREVDERKMVSTKRRDLFWEVDKEVEGRCNYFLGLTRGRYSWRRPQGECSAA